MFHVKQKGWKDDRKGEVRTIEKKVEKTKRKEGKEDRENRQWTVHKREKNDR